MAIKSYYEDGKKLWQVYVNLRSRKIPTLREQKRVYGIESKDEARTIHNRLIQELSRAIAQKEYKGVTWGELVYRWERYWKQYPTRRFNDSTLLNDLSRINKRTENWKNRCASEISIGDARDLFRHTFEEGLAYDTRRAIKGTLNKIFKWGIEEKLIQGIDRAPIRDLDIEGKRNQKFPEILDETQIIRLLHLAEEQDHPWYPVWFMALNSGMRSGELEALRKSDLSLVPISAAKKLDSLQDGDPKKTYGLIRLERAWKAGIHCYGPTKAQYWRNIPINSDLYWWLVGYLPKANFGKDEYGERFFPLFPAWKKGEQAKVLRLFCEANGLKSVKFHTFRACFATQLLGRGVPETKVMKIGGWQDLKTMMIYVRLAGIQEMGATEGLKFRGSTRAPYSGPETPDQNMSMRSVSEIDFSESVIEKEETLKNVVVHDTFRGRKTS